MPSENTTTPAQAARPGSEREFTVDSANRALVLVRRIVQDIVNEYNALMRLRTERDELATKPPGSAARLEEIRSQIDRCVDHLNRLKDELAEIGVELKDWAQGLVDFPGTYQGRKIWLCWRLGEPAVSYWHEFHAGFDGRQPIGPNFGDARLIDTQPEV